MVQSKKVLGQDQVREVCGGGKWDCVLTKRQRDFLNRHYGGEPEKLEALSHYTATWNTLGKSSIAITDDTDLKTLDAAVVKAFGGDGNKAYWAITWALQGEWW